MENFQIFFILNTFLFLAKPNALPIIVPLLALSVVFVFGSMPFVYFFIKDEYFKRKICALYGLVGISCAFLGICFVFAIVIGFIGSIFSGKSIFQVSPFSFFAFAVGLISLGVIIIFLTIKIEPQKLEEETESQSTSYKKKSDYISLNLDD